MEDSGNCYKPVLLLALLGRSCRWVSVDILKGESRTPEFLACNPNGRVPVLGLGDGRYLAESNAMLWYLADGSRWLPEDAFERALVLQWMFFEQYSHEPFIATPRYWIHILGRPDAHRDEISKRRPAGLAALGVLEQQLEQHDFLVADRFTIADIALYAYTHVADEGGYDLAPYPAIRRWLARVAAQPGFVPMARRPAS
jgi:glutathione S-transferase